MIPENTKKLGFGTMRLPLTDPEDTAAIDVNRFCEMVDHFLDKGFSEMFALHIPLTTAERQFCTSNKI